ncbi:MAG: hypothetical protein Q9201_000767 [Fulgogasparrea decipioides]
MPGTADKPIKTLPEDAGRPSAVDRSNVSVQRRQEDRGLPQALERRSDLALSSSSRGEAAENNAVATSGQDTSWLKPAKNDSEKQQRTSEGLERQTESRHDSGESATNTAIHMATAQGSEQLVNGASSSDEAVQPQAPEFEQSFRMVIHVHDEIALRIACLDTCADMDLISIQVVEDLGLCKERYKGPAIKPLGGSYVPEWLVTFDWHVAKFRKTYKTTFAVLSHEYSVDFDVLLGKKSIKEIGFYQKDHKVWFSTTQGDRCVSDAVDTPDNRFRGIGLKD